MKLLPALVGAAILSVVAESGFLAGLWPYGLALSGGLAFTFLAGWYLRLEIYVLLSLGLALVADGLAADPNFIRTKLALLVVIFITGLRYQGRVPNKLQLGAILGTGLLIANLWAYTRSDLPVFYIVIATINALVATLLWLLVIKFLPDPSEGRLFGP